MNEPSHAIRYRVMAKVRDEDVAFRFEHWMVQNHGPDLLKVPGCLEFRLYRDSALVYECAYLFASETLLNSYLENGAPALRAKGRALFPESEVTFTRDQSPLLADERKPF